MARSVSSRPSFCDTAPSTIFDPARDENIGNTIKNWERIRLPWNNGNIVNSERTVSLPTPPFSCYNFHSHSLTTTVENEVSKRKLSNTIRSSNRVRGNDGNSSPSNKNEGKPVDTKNDWEPNSKPKKVTTLSLASKKRRGQKITMVTAYDYPSAVHVDRAGVDAVLVGDSCAMVELGFETTQVCLFLQAKNTFFIMPKSFRY